MKNKKSLTIGILFIAVVIISVVGLTYAFFTASAQGNEQASSTIIETADLRLLYTDGTDTIEMNEALPGQSKSKTFTVENKGNVDLSYTIDITDYLNEFTNGELVYSLTSDNGGANVERIPFPTEFTDEFHLATATIAPGVVQTYTIEVLFLETGSDQNSNQGARFSGKVQINSAGEYSLGGISVTGKVVDSEGNPINGAIVEVHSTVKTGVTNAEGKYTIPNVLPGEHTVKVKTSNTDVKYEKELHYQIKNKWK